MFHKLLAIKFENGMWQVFITQLTRIAQITNCEINENVGFAKLNKFQIGLWSATLQEKCGCGEIEFRENQDTSLGLIWLSLHLQEILMVEGRLTGPKTRSSLKALDFHTLALTYACNFPVTAVQTTWIPRVIWTD